MISDFVSDKHHSIAIYFCNVLLQKIYQCELGNQLNQQRWSGDADATLTIALDAYLAFSNLFRQEDYSTYYWQEMHLKFKPHQIIHMLEGKLADWGVAKYLSRQVAVLLLLLMNKFKTGAAEPNVLGPCNSTAVVIPM